jgi:hypothetical protein
MEERKFWVLELGGDVCSYSFFFSLEMVGESRRWCVCGGWNGGKVKGFKGRGTVEGWTPGPHIYHAPGGWSYFEKSSL